jgi:hypothetical protein
MVRYAVIGWACAIAGCGPGTPAERPIVLVSMDELAREYAADPAACRQKYETNRIEVTGPVDAVRTDDTTESAVHVRFKPATGGAGEPLDVTFHLSQEPKLLPIIPGQTATVRGVLAADKFRLKSAELVDPGPAPVTTIPGLVAEAKNPAAFHKKYADGGIKVTGKLMEIRRVSEQGANVLELELTVGDNDPAALEKYVVAKVRASERTDQKYRLVSLKRGNTITIVGKVAAVDAAGTNLLTLEHAHVIP